MNDLIPSPTTSVKWTNFEKKPSYPNGARALHRQRLPVNRGLGSRGYAALWGPQSPGSGPSEKGTWAPSPSHPRTQTQMQKSCGKYQQTPFCNVKNGICQKQVGLTKKKKKSLKLTRLRGKGSKKSLSIPFDVLKI